LACGFALQRSSNPAARERTGDARGIEALHYSAGRYLKQITSIGVLQETVVGKEKLFLHPGLMNLLIRDGNAFDVYL
jgi:hypothetical protein